MNIRKWLYFTLLRVRGERIGTHYDRYIREDRNGISTDTTRKQLIQMLEHCQKNVPYYREIINRLGNNFYEDPEEYLKNFPILTKDLIRQHFDELKSADLPRRKWYFTASGGSTGEPIRLIQDYEFAARAGAITLFFSRLIGRETGECEVYLWGSERDIIQGHEKWQARLAHRITNSIFVNAFQMTPEKMRAAIALINERKPKLIIGYVEAIIGLAQFAVRERIPVVAQKAIITSAQTLFPYMRERIEKVFQCKVFNRYGTREVGIVACERPGYEGLWIPPWGNYIEILDCKGNRVPDGTEGAIMVTSLSNYAMPLLRYRIEDYGILSPTRYQGGKYIGQVLEAVTGRTYAIFKARNGVLVAPGIFVGLVWDKDWIQKFQIIQKGYSHILFRIVSKESEHHQGELDEIIANSKKVLGDDCRVDFEFVDDIAASGSGKLHFILSEVPE